MLHRHCVIAALGGFLWLGAAAALPAADDDPQAERPQPRRSASGELYAAPPLQEVRARAVEWAASRGVEDEAVLEEVARLWAAGDEGPSARDLLDRVVETFALVDPATRRFVEACRFVDAPITAPGPEAIDAAGDSEFYTANLRMFYARYLVQRRMYDEALEQFAVLDPRQVVDPAACLFYRAVCEHQLLMKDEGLATLEKLLKNTEGVPASWSTVAALMEHDLQALEPKTLGQIARKMRDSERRLDLAHAGQRVQKVQSEIIEDLDELIEKLEQMAGG